MESPAQPRDCAMTLCDWGRLALVGAPGRHLLSSSLGKGRGL